MAFPKQKESADETRHFARRSKSDCSRSWWPTNKELADPAGQLVDFLDDPDEYVEDGKPVTLITDAVAKIRSTCKSD